MLVPPSIKIKDLKKNIDLDLINLNLSQKTSENGNGEK